jgi:hypothetical protein
MIFLSAVWLGGFLLLALPYIVFAFYVRMPLKDHVGYLTLSLIWPVGVPYAIYRMFSDEE